MTRFPGRSLTDIVGSIYEAAEDPLAWAHVLRLVGQEFGSTVNVFTLSDRSSPHSQVVVSDGHDPKWEQEYNDYYYSTNVILNRLSPLLSEGRVICSTDVLPDGELLRSEYYEDFLRRRDVFYLLGSVVSANPTSSAVLTLARSRKHGPWSIDDRDSIAFLTPHLQRAVRLSGSFARIRQQRDGLLNRLPMGIVVLDDSGKVEFLNRAAETILDKKDGLCWGSKGVSAVDPTESSRLVAMIRGAKLMASGKGLAGGGNLSITRSAGRPLSVLVAPMMPTAASLLSRSPRVAMFITDPEATQLTNLARLMALFNLTPAESRMAGQLLEGKSVVEAANALRITPQTARVHLKRIFGKTYTSRQSELMRLLLSSPASLRD